MGHSEHTYGTLLKLKWDTIREKLHVTLINKGCYTNVTGVLHLCQGTRTGLKLAPKSEIPVSWLLLIIQLANREKLLVHLAVLAQNLAGLKLEHHWELRPETHQ